MRNDLWQQAKSLASRNYEIVLERDELSDGSVIFVASNPELPGCMSQGESIVDAVVNLNEARIDYIYSLLEDSLLVPEPSSLYTVTGGVPGATTSTYVFDCVVESSPTFDDTLEAVVQPTNRVVLVQQSVKMVSVTEE